MLVLGIAIQNTPLNFASLGGLPSRQCTFDIGMSPRSPTIGEAALNKPTLSTATSVNILSGHKRAAGK